MDWLNKLKMKVKGFIFTWMFIWVPLLILAIILGLVYLIATSNLPDWFRWWLLR